MRYFLFHFTFITSKNETGDGNVFLAVDGFPPETEVRKLSTVDNPKSFVVTSWNEFKSEQDYKDFLGIE